MWLSEAAYYTQVLGLTPALGELGGGKLLCPSTLPAGAGYNNTPQGRHTHPSSQLKQSSEVEAEHGSSRSTSASEFKTRNLSTRKLGVVLRDQS